MEINETTATSLGNKLAELDLTPEELQLLKGALTRADEVEGFGRNDFAGAAPTLLPLIQAPIRDRWGSQQGSDLWKSDGTATDLWKSDGTT